MCFIRTSSPFTKAKEFCLRRFSPGPFRLCLRRFSWINCSRQFAMVVQSAVKYYGSCAVSHFDCYIVISCFRIDVKSFYETKGVLLLQISPGPCIVSVEFQQSRGTPTNRATGHAMIVPVRRQTVIIAEWVRRFIPVVETVQGMRMLRSSHSARDNTVTESWSLLSLVVPVASSLKQHALCIMFGQ